MRIRTSACREKTEDSLEKSEEKETPMAGDREAEKRRATPTRRKHGREG
jgi:hypothetical protein